MQLFTPSLHSGMCLSYQSKSVVTGVSSCFQTQSPKPSPSSIWPVIENARYVKKKKPTTFLSTVTGMLPFIFWQLKGYLKQNKCTFLTKGRRNAFNNQGSERMKSEGLICDIWLIDEGRQTIKLVQCEVMDDLDTHFSCICWHAGVMKLRLCTHVPLSLCCITCIKTNNCHSALCSH